MNSETVYYCDNIEVLGAEGLFLVCCGFIS
jgi:hypothetical protein